MKRVHAQKINQVSIQKRKINFFGEKVAFIKAED